MKITLLGDSIFDNRAYVGTGEKDVITHLAEKSVEWNKRYLEEEELERGEGWRVPALRAVDGAITSDVSAQLGKIPKDTTHLVLSIGGNDALKELSLMSVKGVGHQLFKKLYDASAEFEKRYNTMLDEILALELPTTICTIYFPRFDDDDTQAATTAALSAFNDVIIRVAFEREMNLIDLRLVCNEWGDYANAIEPSHQGGEKIAKVILKAWTEEDMSKVHF